MSIHLVRHGEVENPRRLVYADLPGFGLSERGRAEAAAAAEHLAGLGVTAVFASPLERAQETASIIAARTGAAVTTREDLTEWYGARRWKGVTWEDLPVEFPGEVEAYRDHPTDLPFAEEAIQTLAERMAAAVRDIVKTHPDGAVAVSHQEPIQAGRLLLVGRPLDTLHTDRPGHCDVLTLEPGTPWRELAHWIPNVGKAQDPWPPITRR